jgi:hypothetical protein
MRASRQASREYLVCVHVMTGGPISLFHEATEHVPSRDGEADGWFEEEPLMARTTLICGNYADRLMADQDFVG